PKLGRHFAFRSDARRLAPMDQSGRGAGEAVLGVALLVEKLLPWLLLVGCDTACGSETQLEGSNRRRRRYRVRRCVAFGRIEWHLFVALVPSSSAAIRPISRQSRVSTAAALRIACRRRAASTALGS